MEYEGERKWLTNWLAEEETRSDIFPTQLFCSLGAAMS